MTNDNEMAVIGESFIFPDVAIDDIAIFSTDELADEADGLNLGFRSVKIPAGGGLQFELPGDDPENPDYTKTIEGVIVHNNAANAYWIGPMEENDGAPPTCVSLDGKLGIGEPGGDCFDCPLNKFGSGENGKGKLCKNTRHLYILESGAYIPLRLTLPPTSIKPFSDFFSMVFASRRRSTCGSVVQIGLKRIENGNTYSVATFKKVCDLTGEQLAKARAYSQSFKETASALNRQRAADLLNGTHTDCIEATDINAKDELPL